MMSSMLLDGTARHKARTFRSSVQWDNSLSWCTPHIPAGASTILSLHLVLQPAYRNKMSLSGKVRDIGLSFGCCALTSDLDIALGGTWPSLGCSTCHGMDSRSKRRLLRQLNPRDVHHSDPWRLQNFSK